MSLAVVTDSAACLPQAEAVRHGIDVIPLHAKDGTTSRPAVDELARAYSRALTRADEVLAIHVSSALSGTVDNAHAAATSLGQDAPRVRVLDSGTSGAGLAFAAIAATGATDARHGAALALDTAARATVLLLAPDLGALVRGGRIDRATALMDGALGIRPILQVTPQGIRAVETVRGMARARRQLVARAVQAAGGQVLPGPRPPIRPVRVAVHDAEAPEQGLALMEELGAALASAGAEVVTLLHLPADPATTVHVGPGALAVVVAPA